MPINILSLYQLDYLVEVWRLSKSRSSRVEKNECPLSLQAYEYANWRTDVVNRISTQPGSISNNFHLNRSYQLGNISKLCYISKCIYESSTIDCLYSIPLWSLVALPHSFTLTSWEKSLCRTYRMWTIQVKLYDSTSPRFYIANNFQVFNNPLRRRLLAVSSLAKQQNQWQYQLLCLTPNYLLSWPHPWTFPRPRCIACRSHQSYPFPGTYFASGHASSTCRILYRNAPFKIDPKRYPLILSFLSSIEDGMDLPICSIQ